MRTHLPFGLSLSKASYKCPSPKNRSTQRFDKLNANGFIQHIPEE